MVKVLIINDSNHRTNIEKLVVYNKEGKNHSKARFFHYELDGYDYEDIDMVQFNIMKQFFMEAT